MIDECSGTHLKPVPGEAPSDPSVTVMVKGKGRREEGSENESGLKVGKVEGAQLLGWVMPDPLNIASVQTSACVSPSSASIWMGEVEHGKMETAAPTQTAPFMQTIPPAPETMIVVGPTPETLPAAALSEAGSNDLPVNNTNSPGTTISTLSPTSIETWISSEGCHTGSTIPAMPPPHRVPLTQGNLSLLGRSSTSEQSLDQSSGASMMMQTTSAMSSFVGLTTYLTLVDVQAIILLSQTSNFNEGTFHDTLKSHFGCIDEEAHLLASLAAAGQQDA